MKVLAIMPPEPWMRVNLIETLRQYYCEELHVFHYPGGMGNLGSRSWRKTRDRLNRDLVEMAKSLKFAGRLDLMFCVVYDDFLRVDTAEQLRALNVTMVNYHIDMVFQWHRVLRIAPYFDVLAVAQMINTDRLRSRAARIEWMPMAANPAFYHPRVEKVLGYRHQSSFIGSFNPFRRALLAECVRDGIRPVVYGHGWESEPAGKYRFDWDWYKLYHDLRFYGLPRWRADGVSPFYEAVQRKWSRRYRFEPLNGVELMGVCAHADMPSLFRSTQVNLGFSDTGWHGKANIIHSGRRQSRLRDFEVPMSGGFYLAQEAPDHRDYYRIGQEIETWSEATELRDKVKFYLRNIATAEKIREAGRRRALACHTWKNRFDRLFVELGVMKRESKTATPQTV